MAVRVEAHDSILKDLKPTNTESIAWNIVYIKLAYYDFFVYQSFILSMVNIVLQ